MGRIKDGFLLLRQSWQVVKQDPQLILVMAVGFILQVVVFGTLFVVVFRAPPRQRISGSRSFCGYTRSSLRLASSERSRVQPSSRRLCNVWRGGRHP